jgi:hypothetical protein
MSITTVNYIGALDEPDDIYYNATVVDTNTTPGNKFDGGQISFYDTRDVPILKDSSLYKLEVVNFVLDGPVKDIPILIPVIKTPINSGFDAQTTIYEITLGWNDGTNYFISTRPIIWYPEVSGPVSQPPSVPSLTQHDVPFYYLYSYQWWVRLMNLTVQQCYQDIQLQCATAGVSYGGTVAPIFSFNQDTRLFSLAQDVNTSIVPYGQNLDTNGGYAYYPITSSVTSSIAGTYIQNEASFVGVNQNFIGLIANITSGYYGFNQINYGPTLYYPEYVFSPFLTTGQTIATAYDIVGLNYNILGVNVGKLINPFTCTFDNNLQANYVLATEDKPSVDTLWSPVSTWVITTSQIPIINEYVSNPLNIGSNNTGTNQGSGSAFNRIILETPYDPNQEDYIFYSPPVSVYTSLSPSHQPLRTIDFKMWWRNRLTNTLVPLTLPNSASATLRLHFKKRSSNF